MRLCMWLSYHTAIENALPSIIKALNTTSPFIEKNELNDPASCVGMHPPLPGKKK